MTPEQFDISIEAMRVLAQRESASYFDTHGYPEHAKHAKLGDAYRACLEFLKAQKKLELQMTFCAARRHGAHCELKAGHSGAHQCVINDRMEIWV